MVIGYGFRDSHINDRIIRGYEKGGLEMFIVDPIAHDILGLQPAGAVVGQSPLQLARVPIIGRSTRMLSDTFSGDVLELKNLLRFFETGHQSANRK